MRRTPGCDARRVARSESPIVSHDSRSAHACACPGGRGHDALASVIEAVPEDRRADLCFLQNGMLGPFLEGQGLGDATQVLVYLAVAKLGETPTDGVTDVNPEGLTAANGKHAEAFAARLANASLACHVLDDAAFKASAFEKLIWISAFMLVGAAHPGATVGDVESTHRREVVALIEELVKGTGETQGVAFQEGSVDRLLAYARAVAHFPTAVKEFEWRNGFFHGVSKSALDAARTSSPGRQGRNKAIQAQASREARAAAAKSFASVQEPRGGCVLTFADGSGAKFALYSFGDFVSHGYVASVIQRR